VHFDITLPRPLCQAFGRVPHGQADHHGGGEHEEQLLPHMWGMGPSEAQSLVAVEVDAQSAPRRCTHAADLLLHAAAIDGP
jgi:hypothetical protein